MIVEIIIGIIVIVLFFAILAALIKQRSEYLKMSEFFVKASLEKHMVEKQMEQVMEDNSALRVSESQDFIKFLSSSRDVAFTYIEDVQGRIRNLREADIKADPLLIKIAVDALIDMLPKDDIPNN